MFLRVFSKVYIEMLKIINHREEELLVSLMKEEHPNKYPQFLKAPTTFSFNPTE